jgi:hypothetical protein
MAGICSVGTAPTTGAGTTGSDGIGTTMAGAPGTGAAGALTTGVAGGAGGPEYAPARAADSVTGRDGPAARAG